MFKEVCEIMKNAYERNWITTRDGNCAFKLKDDNKIYMTPGGVQKNRIEEKDILYLEMSKEGEYIFQNLEGKTLTGEWEMHLKILNELSEGCTLHLHPPYTVAAMHAGWELSDLVAPFPEVYRYTKVGKNVTDHLALSHELARDTHDNLFKSSDLKFDIVGQKSHGACAMGRTPAEAFEHFERVEHICKIVLLSGVSPKDIKNKNNIFTFLKNIYS